MTPKWCGISCVGSLLWWSHTPVVSGVTTSIWLTTRLSPRAAAPPELAHSCAQPAQAGRTFDSAKPSSNRNTDYNKLIAFPDNRFCSATLLRYTLNSLCQILTFAAQNLKCKYKAVLISVLSPPQQECLGNNVITHTGNFQSSHDFIH